MKIGGITEWCVTNKEMPTTIRFNKLNNIQVECMRLCRGQIGYASSM